MNDIQYFVVEKLNTTNGYSCLSDTMSIKIASIVMQSDSIFDGFHEQEIVKKVVIPETGALILFVKNKNSLDIDSEFIEYAIKGIVEDNSSTLT